MGFYRDDGKHSRKRTWKFKKGPIKTTVLLRGDYMGFHVNLGECSFRRIPRYRYIRAVSDIRRPRTYVKQWRSTLRHCRVQGLGLILAPITYSSF